MAWSYLYEKSCQWFSEKYINKILIWYRMINIDDTPICQYLLVYNSLSFLFRWIQYEICSVHTVMMCLVYKIMPIFLTIFYHHCYEICSLRNTSILHKNTCFCIWFDLILSFACLINYSKLLIFFKMCINIDKQKYINDTIYQQYINIVFINNSVTYE
jgi:hypothetical protein